MINGGSRRGGKEPAACFAREISVRAARNKRLSVDDSDFERTDYREGSINGRQAWEERRKGRGWCMCARAVRETSRTYFEVARHDFLHLLVHHADEFAQAAQCHKNSARDKTEKPPEQSLIRTINISYVCMCFTAGERRDSRESTFIVDCTLFHLLHLFRIVYLSCVYTFLPDREFDVKSVFDDRELHYVSYM